MNILRGIWTGAKEVLGIGSTGGANRVFEAAKGIGQFIDEQEMTTEERAHHNAKMVEKFGAFMENTIDENTQRSITRRELAILVMRWELAMLTLSAALYKIDADYSAKIYAIATDDPINFFVLGIASFFFGAHIVRAIKK